MKHRDLNFSKHKTPHFAIWKGKIHAAKCPTWKTSSSSTSTGAKKASSSSTDFYYTHFLLDPIDTGLVPHVPAAPTILSKAILDTAVVHNTGYSVEQTSNFKDVVDCYTELREDGKLDDISFHIDEAPIGTTYNQVFKPICFITDYFKYGSPKVKYRVHYGNVMNKAIDSTKNPGYWSFYVATEEKTAFFQDENEQWHSVALEIILPIPLLATNRQMQNYIEEQLDAGKRLHECFIVNTEPDLPRLVENKDNPDKFHYESQIQIRNLNHIVLTFK